MEQNRQFQNYAVLDSGKTKFTRHEQGDKFQNYAVLDSGKTIN